MSLINKKEAKGYVPLYFSVSFQVNKYLSFSAIPSKAKKSFKYEEEVVLGISKSTKTHGRRIAPEIRTPAKNPKNPLPIIAILVSESLFLQT